VSDPSEPQAPSRWADPRERVRLIAGIVVIIAFVALAALAIAASRSDFSISAPAGASPSSATQELPEVPDLAAISTPLPARVPPAPVATVEAPTPADAGEGAPDVAPPPAADEPAPAGKPCAQLGLPAPQQVGGIQSLVRLIPLFGPFSAEAFAMLPAFQPGMDALGPLFPLFEQGLDAAAPLLDAVTPVVQQLGQAGFGVLAPLYGPYRPAVLDAEAQLAAFLQPIVESLASAPGSECLVALEGLLASLAPGAQ
jgi:hypothetical protein